MLRRILPLRLVRLRAQHGISQASLAASAGLAASTVSALESGQLADLHVSTMAALGERFEVGLDFLAGLDTEPIARGIIPPYAAPAGPPRVCPSCGSQVRSGAVHTLAECVFWQHGAGRSTAVIAAQTGLMVATVDAILREEYELQRRLRR